MERTEKAERLARERASSPRVETARDGRARSRRLAIGDPQAPFPKFLAILERHRLLAEDGTLAPDAMLVSMGDHFDWGEVGDRAKSGPDGLALLAWLAAHPADQAVIIAGNHDLARVGELASFDDALFARARDEADAIYRNGKTDPRKEKAFLERWPALPSAEAAARDFSGFVRPQRDLVDAVLRTGRMRLALAAAADFLICHAGVTVDDLATVVGADSIADAEAIASALDAALSRAANARGGAPLEVPGLHRPGDAARGEGRGVVYQRAGDPGREDVTLYAGPPRRRFDPRRLPVGLTQAIGHIRDRKSRKLLGPEWTDAAKPRDGVLRHLRSDGERVAYAHGTPARAGGEALVLHTDGAMLQCELADYQLLDLDTRSAAVIR